MTLSEESTWRYFIELRGRVWLRFCVIYNTNPRRLGSVALRAKIMYRNPTGQHNPTRNDTGSTAIAATTTHCRGLIECVALGCLLSTVLAKLLQTDASRGGRPLGSTHSPSTRVQGPESDSSQNFFFFTILSGQQSLALPRPLHPSSEHSPQVELQHTSTPSVLTPSNPSRPFLQVGAGPIS